MQFQEIQTLLAEAGFDPGVIDGIPGQETEAAVRAFQREHPPLKVDGLAGVATQRVLLDVTRHVTAPPRFRLSQDFCMRAFPHGRPDCAEAFDAIPAEVALAGVDTPLRAVHFLAQVSAETGQLATLEENLHYSAGRLLAVFPKYVHGAVDAAALVRAGPQAIANRVYSGRLGNIHPGDGWTYRGGGFFDTTGRENYRKVGHEEDPETVRQPVPGLRAALNFWQQHGCAHVADAGDALALRRIINGGTNGMQTVLSELHRLSTLAGL